MILNLIFLLIFFSNKIKQNYFIVFYKIRLFPFLYHRNYGADASHCQFKKYKNKTEYFLPSPSNGDRFNEMKCYW